MNIPSGDKAYPEEPQVGETSITELSGGIFNMLVSLIFLHVKTGKSKAESCAIVAEMLDGYKTALLDYSEIPKK